MIVYQCLICDERFAAPIQKRILENLDGENGWTLSVERFCPACGSEYIREVDEDAEDET